MASNFLEGVCLYAKNDYEYIIHQVATAFTTALLIQVFLHESWSIRVYF